MKEKILLSLIILAAIVIRFYNLGQNPPSLYWDEIALGYNAYSIAETAKDEEGAFLPVQYFRSFGDFKPPVYIYAAVPMIKLLGLNEWTTRFPSAFFGTLSIIVTYYLTRKILIRQTKSNKENEFLTQKRINYIALIAALLLALSPWHTQISRVAYEANVAHFLALVGIWFFFIGLDKHKWKLGFFLGSGISFTLAMYTFNSSRVFIPLLVASLLFIYIKELVSKEQRNLKPFIIAAIISLVLTLPALQHMLSSQGQLRYKEVNIFSNQEVVKLSNQRIEQAGHAWWANIFNNRRVLFAQDWLDGYFRHFSAKFLLISGDVNPRFSIQDIGQLYLVEIPFLLIGLYVMLSRPNKNYAFILVWLLMAPIPAAFAREVPHALRTLNILPTFQIITALGFLYTIYALQQRAGKFNRYAAQGIIAGSTILLIGQLYYYQHNYYDHYPKYSETEWQYGYKQMMQELSKIDQNYDRVVITDGLGRPYINVLFYKQYSPALFQVERKAETDQTGFGFINVYAFNKYQFRGINWKKEIADQKTEEKVLVVGTPQEIEENKFTKATVKNLKGQTVFILNEIPKGQDALLELK